MWKMLSGKQQAVYRPLVAEAWQKHCSASGIDPRNKAAKETWYRVQLVKACGCWTTKQVSDPESLDAVLMHFAVLANNDRQIKWVAVSAQRRAIWRLKQTMVRAGVGWAYVHAMFKRMRFGDLPLEDRPAEQILKVNAALSISVNRNSRREIA
jgi:hypothetical protein